MDRPSLMALSAWTPRQTLVALASAIAVAPLLGIATVLIPNDLFTRDIPPVWWNYPVWLVTSAMTGLLIGTYVKPERRAGSPVAQIEPAGQSESASASREERRTGRFAVAGGMLAWFAVAVVWRLRGQLSCPLPASRKEAVTA